jgi:hypothetical protein
VRPYFVLEGNICALLATKDHVNVFLYDGAIVPDPAGIITGGHENKTARTVADAHLRYRAAPVHAERPMTAPAPSRARSQCWRSRQSPLACSLAERVSTGYAKATASS